MPVTQLGFLPGEWADVDWSPADEAFVFAREMRPGRLLVELVDAPLGHDGWFYDLGRWGLYLRCAADGAGNVCCVLQDGRDRNPATGQFYPAIVVLFPRDGPPREIVCPAGPAFGQNAVEVFGLLSGGFWVRVMQSPTSFWDNRVTADGDWSTAFIKTCRETSQGFADWPLMLDDVRLSVPGMVCPSTADGLSLGQNTSGPDRLVARAGATLFTALPGAAFEPHLVSNGQGVWMGCARTPQGAALFSLAAPFVADAPQPEPPVVLPDVPWTTDPTGVIEDIADWLFSPNQGPDVHLSPDGKVRFYCKSTEGSGDGPGLYIGEHWSISDDPNDFNVGHLEDASLGRRIYQGKEVTPETLPVPPDQVPGVWSTLKLQRNWWADGARLWMPRRLVSGTRIRYKTTMYWTVPPKETPTTNEWRMINVDIEVDVGYGRLNGREVTARVSYIPNGNRETNYYHKPNGSNAWVIAAGNTDPWGKH